MVSTAELKRRSDKLAPVDPDVTLPAAVRAAAAKAQALHGEVYTPAPQQENNGQERQQEEAKTIEGTVEPPAPKAGKETVPVSAPAAGEDYEHKYNSLKGRYDKQEETIRQLMGNLDHLRSEVSRISAQPPAPVQRTRENTFQPLTKDEKDAYGEDFLDVSARAALEKIDPELAELRSTVAALQNTLASVAETTGRTQAEVMHDTLTKALPNWREINRDRKFLAWVALPDPYSGVIRRDMMRQAHAQGDAQRVLRFFNGFLTDEAVTDPAPALKTDPTEGKVALETLAAPGRAKAPAATVTTPPGEKETISRAQIANFYRLVNRGHYVGNEEEKARLERMIFDAEREGRITG